MTREEKSKIESEIIRLQQIVLNYYSDRTKRPIEGDEMQPNRDKLKELRSKIGIGQTRGETIVYLR